MNLQFVIKVLLIFVLIFSAKGFASTNNTVTIAINNWIGNSPFLVAEKMNLFKKYGVNVKLIRFSTTSGVLEAVATDKIDGCTPSLNQVIFSVSHGFPIKVVMPLDISDGADAIVANDSIRTIASIVNHKIVYNFYSPSQLLLDYALKQKGISIKSIHSINIPAGDVPSALASGSVSIGVTWQPHVQQAIKIDGGHKFHVLYSSKNAKGLISDTVAFNSRFIKKHPLEVMSIIKGYISGLNYMDENRVKSFAIISKYLGITKTSAEEDYKGVSNIPLSKMQAFLTRNNSLFSFYTSGKIINSIYLEDDIIKKGQVPKMSEIIDDKFVLGIVK